MLPTVCTHNHVIPAGVHISIANRTKCVWNEETQQYDQFVLEEPPEKLPEITPEMIKKWAEKSQSEETAEKEKNTPDTSENFILRLIKPKKNPTTEKDMEAIFAKELSGDLENPKPPTPAQIAKKAEKNRKKKEAKKAKKLFEKAEELEMLKSLKISDSKDSEGVVKN